MGAIVVTGAGRGIGAATAVLAAAEGFAVCVNYVSKADKAESVVNRILENGGRACSVQADVSSENDVRRLFDTAENELGPLGGLVNNAAVLEKQSGFREISAARLQRILDTNVTGAFLCAREAVSRMAQSAGGGGGAIVNVSSCAARTGAPMEYIDYAMTKGALDSMTVGLAREVAGDGIRVNAVRPGFIHTDMHADGGEPGRVERLKSSIPLRRGGEPDEVARAVVWLLSDLSSYCTGTFIDVAGGVA